MTRSVTPAFCSAAGGRPRDDGGETPQTYWRPPRTAVPEINLSRIPVGGDAAGLMFAAGSVAVVIIGVPDMAWYFVSALLCAALLAWALFAYRSTHARRALNPRPLGLF